MSRRSVSLFVLAAAALVGLPSAVQAQMFFEAQWLQLHRNNNASAPFITGPEAVSPGGVGFDSSPGYRLTLGSSLGDYQVDASFSQIDTWQGRSSGIFDRPVVFDDSANNPFVVGPNLPGNSLALPHGLAIASRHWGPDVNETLLGHHLRPGAEYTIRNQANFREFEVNLGTNRQARRWRVSAGYRHIRLNERTIANLGGIFDARDIATGESRDGLSDAAMRSAGFTVVRGAADGFDAFDVGLPDRPTWLDMEHFGRADNELNGAQFTVGLILFERSRFLLEGIGKAGIYRNRVHGGVQETVAGSLNDDSVYQRTFTDDAVTAAFAGNLGLRGVIGLTDYINVVAGYEVLFLSGVALSSDQTRGLGTNVLGDPFYRVTTNGSLIAHGSTLGLEILW